MQINKFIMNFLYILIHNIKQFDKCFIFIYVREFLNVLSFLVVKQTIKILS